jgi:nicotinate-nucleotide pyrophosphorylase (carboxylating)
MTGWMHPYPSDWGHLLELALSEDIGPGDLTAGCLNPDTLGSGYIEAQADGVLCGVGVAASIFSEVADVEVLVNDGSACAAGTRVLNIHGELASILTHERVALNFLMHLSGVASLTAKFVEAIQGSGAVIVDTRKTLPGMRSLQKYAVRCGGGRNHRMGLFDAVMIKDNHIVANGSIAAAVHAVREKIPHTAMVEVEADRPDQADEAVAAGANIVLLDNMSPAMMSEIVTKHKGSGVKFEASGGVNLTTVRAIAESGVDLISVGALTHSAVALPLHLELD